MDRVSLVKGLGYFDSSFDMYSINAEQVQEYHNQADRDKVLFVKDD